MTQSHSTGPAAAVRKSGGQRSLFDAIAIVLAVLAGSAIAFALFSHSNIGMIGAVAGGFSVTAVLLMTHLLIRRGDEIGRLSARVDGLELTFAGSWSGAEAQPVQPALEAGSIRPDHLQLPQYEAAGPYQADAHAGWASWSNAPPTPALPIAPPPAPTLHSHSDQAPAAAREMAPAPATAPAAALPSRGSAPAPAAMRDSKDPGSAVVRRPRVVSGWQGEPPAVISAAGGVRLAPAASAAAIPAAGRFPAPAAPLAPAAMDDEVVAPPALPEAPTAPDLPLSAGLSELAQQLAFQPTPQPEPEDLPALELPPVDLQAAADGWHTVVNPVGHMIDHLATRLEAEVAQSDDAIEQGASAIPPAAPSSKLPDAGMARVLEALEAGRIEVHLQPILTLADQNTVSYEAFARLRDGAGGIIAPGEVDEIAHELGLKRDIAAIALFRAVHVLARLQARGKLLPLFVNAPPELLTDGDLFSEFVDVMKEVRGIADHLVLEFTLEAARAFGEAELESLETLYRLGFTISLDEVRSIEMDFEPLVARGLAFVKVPVEAYAAGLDAGDNVVATTDIRPMFEEAGLQVIVCDIDGDGDLDLLQSEGVVYGQGSVFADPRPIKADVLAGENAAA